MIKIKLLLSLLASCLLLLASCGGSDSSFLSGGNGGGTGGSLSSPSVSLSDEELLPDGDSPLSEGGLSPSPAPIAKTGGRGGLSIDRNGNIIGLYTIVRNPCKDKPCAEKKENPPTEEWRRKTTMPWELLKGR